MIHGNMTHYPSGRKKKYNAWRKTKRKPVEFKPYVAPDTFRRSTPDYPSLNSTSHGTTGGTLTSQEKKDISSNYTIAPAYNKGAYQVIGSNNIKDIGK